MRRAAASLSSPLGVSSSLDYSGRWKAQRFRVFCVLLLILAAPRAAFMYLRLRVRSPPAVRWLRDNECAPFKTVYAVAVSRLIRRALRMRALRLEPVVLWPRSLPSSCVLAFFHTPWDRAIARLCERNACLVRAKPCWAGDLGGRYVVWDTGGLRSLVRRVARGAACAVAADNFVAAAEGGFFGTSRALSPAAIRLAAVTGRPLVAVWPRHRLGVITFELGPPIPASTCAERPEQARQIVGQFFETAVRRDPASWSRLMPFLERELVPRDRTPSRGPLCLPSPIGTPRL